MASCRRRFLTVERSFRRARLRQRVHQELCARGRMTLGGLVDATGIRPDRSLGILRGAPPAYSVGLSLVQRRLVREVGDVGAEAFGPTSLAAAVEGV